MNTDHSVVEAKNLYITRLCNLITPHIYSTIKVVWKKCKDNRNAYTSFQQELATIPKWNQMIIDSEYEKVTSDKNNGCDIDKLVEAVFLSNITVLSSLRKNKQKKIDITIPDTKKLLHTFYIQAARDIFEFPFLVDDRDHMEYQSIQRNIKLTNTLITQSIEKIIIDSIPFQQVLDSYLDDIQDTGVDVEPTQIGGHKPDLFSDQQHHSDDTSKNFFDDDNDSIKSEKGDDQNGTFNSNKVDGELDNSNGINHDDGHESDDDDPFMHDYSNDPNERRNSFDQDPGPEQDYEMTGGHNVETSLDNSDKLISKDNGNLDTVVINGEQKQQYGSGHDDDPFFDD